MERECAVPGQSNQFSNVWGASLQDAAAAAAAVSVAIAAETSWHPCQRSVLKGHLCQCDRLGWRVI